MKKIKSKFGLMALLVACMLTACSEGNDESMADMQMNNAKADVQSAVFEGEWTIDKEVVDTARLEVSSVLKLRLPEEYLMWSCFEKEMLSSIWPGHFELKGLPVMLMLRSQGYTSETNFSSIVTSAEDDNGMMLNYPVCFFVDIDGISHRVDVLSDEQATAVYRNGNGMWTLGIPVSSYHIVNLETLEEGQRTPHLPFTLYYNTTKRIR